MLTSNAGRSNQSVLEFAFLLNHQVKDLLAALVTPIHICEPTLLIISKNFINFSFFITFDTNTLHTKPHADRIWKKIYHIL